MKQGIITITSSLFLLAILFSCNRDLSEVSWKTDVAIPLATSTLSLEEIITEDSTFSTDNEQLLHIIHTEEIYTLNSPLDSLIDIEINPFVRTFTLSSLELGAQNFSDTVFMEEIIELSGIDGIADGSQLPTFFVDLLPTLDLPEQVIDISDFFERAILNNGLLSIDINNNLPLVINSMDFEIRNTLDNEIIFNESITNITEFSTRNITFDLAQSLNGTEIQGNLTVSIGNIDISAPSSFGATIPINFADFIAFSISLIDLEVESATAIFPAQNVVDLDEDVELQGLEDAELIFAVLDTGIVNVQVRSTLPIPITVRYTLPSATQNGIPFSFEAIVPPSIGGAISFDENFPFFNYDIDLTGADQNSFNRFNSNTTARINDTETIVDLSLDDTLSIILQVATFKPSFIRGYLGRDTIEVGPETIDFDLPGSIDLSQIEVEDVRLDFVVENHIGVEGQLELRQLTAQNTTTGDTRNLPLPSTTTVIEAGIDLGNEAQSRTTTIAIDNAEDLININPDQLSFELALETNPNGNTPLYSNFAYNESGLSASVNVEIPFSVRAAGFVLMDTVDLDFGDDVTTPDQVSSGIISFIIDNGFPVEATIEAIFLDALGNPIDTLAGTDAILSAVIDANSGQVSTTTQTKLDFAMPNERANAILLAQRVIFRVVLDTKPDNEFVEFYSFYAMDIAVTADFNLLISDL